MDKEKLQSIISDELTDATNYSDTEFTSNRIEATDYYLGEPFGNEVDGKSNVVDTVVADTIDSIMPSLLRIFTSGDDYVRFVGRTSEDEPKAKQATDYVNFIINNDNDAFRIFYNWLKDSLLYRMGVVQFYVDEKEDTTEEEYVDLTDDEYSLLTSNPDVEIVEHQSTEATIQTPEGMEVDHPSTHEVKMNRKKSTQKIKVDNVPPEEFLFNRRAKSLEDAHFICHRSKMSVSDLVAMGYDREEIEKYSGHNEDETENEKQIRFQDVESSSGKISSDPSMQLVDYYEIYLKTDLNDDGIAELTKVCAIGHEASYILKTMPCDQIPFAIISPILMPHRMVGRSIYDLTHDLQRIKSVLLRQYLDNTYAVNNARVQAVEGAVNFDDLLDNVAGGVVRVRQMGAVQPLNVPAVGNQILPLMAEIDKVKEERTGMSKASMGLDAEALQSTTASAVNHSIKSAQSKIEMYARTIAETGVKDLFKGIFHLVTKYSNQKRIIRLRNDFVPIDPTEWDSEFDLQVEVGLGRGSEDEQMRGLAVILAEQKQIMQTLGVENEVVKPDQYINTLKRMAELNGFKDTDQFFSLPQPKPQGQQPPQPNPMEIQMQAQMQKEQAEMQMEERKMQAELELKREEMKLKIELEREIAREKLQLRREEIANEIALRQQQISAGGGEVSTNLPNA